jgi:hypothetical protein
MLYGHVTPAHAHAGAGPQTRLQTVRGLTLSFLYPTFWFILSFVVEAVLDSWNDAEPKRGQLVMGLHRTGAVSCGVYRFLGMYIKKLNARYTLKRMKKMNTVDFISDRNSF